MEKQQQQNVKNNNFILNRLGRGSFLSQHRRIWHFAFLLKLNDRCFAGFLAFIQPVVQWITRQWSFALILSPWNARFSLLLVLGKYSYEWMNEWMNKLYFTRVVEKTRGLFTSSPRPWGKLLLTKDTVSYSVLSTCTFIQFMLKWTPANRETSR